MPLERAELKPLLERMQHRHRVLESEIREGARRVRHDSTGELVGAPPDPADTSVADLIADIDNAEVLRDAAELRDIDEALVRMEEGSYGVCIDCDQDIALARLEAQPTALRCIRCQEVYERTHASPAAPTL